LFSGEEALKKAKVLSGGEKVRCMLAKMMLEGSNFLVVDEPTNHLDMRSKDVLKDAIKAFDGTVIVVSHDREFLDGLVDKVYEFGNKKVREHLGGIYEFLETKKISSLQELERKNPVFSSSKSTIFSENKMDYEARKEQNKKIRKIEKQIEETEKQIAQIEQEISELEEKLQQPDFSSDSSLYCDYQSKKHFLEQKLYEWELLGEELEELKKIK
jgi:ATP-binding cassette subfamily F protein 3